MANLDFEIESPPVFSIEIAPTNPFTGVVILQGPQGIVNIDGGNAEGTLT